MIAIFASFSSKILRHLLFSYFILLLLSKPNEKTHWLPPNLSFQLSFAWDTEGHQAIGMTTMSTLLGNVASQVKRLMGGKDVVDVASWAHRVEAKYPKTIPLHFQYQTTAWDCIKATTTNLACPNNNCLVPALQHFYGRLIGRSDLVSLTYPDGLQLTDSDVIKFLVNLVGDLHQPLHLGFAEDTGGDNITIAYMNAAKEKQQTTLYRYWDSNLIRKLVEERPAFWYGGWTHAHSLGNKLHELRSEWDDHDPETRHLLFEKWATESLHFACNKAYKDPYSGAVISNGYDIGQAYELGAMELIKHQILVAGARIAFILNTVLNEKDAVRLRQGSGIELPLEEELVQFGGGTSSSNQRYFRSFCINVVIIAVVLSAFAYIVRFYNPSTANRNAPTTRSMSHIEKRS